MKLSEKKEYAFIFCPPVYKFQEQPKDQSKCEMIDCPICNNKMWFSEKKKFWEEVTKKHREVIKCCYDCFEKLVKENPEIMREHTRIDL